MEKSNTRLITGEIVVPARQDLWENLMVNGKLTLEEYSGVYGIAEVLSGSVELGNFAFLLSLHMPNGGEIFFRGKKPCIRTLQANGIIIHIPKNCERWTDFVQISHVTNIKVIRDII